MKVDRFERAVRIDAPREMVYAWHVRPGALERLSPPWEKPRVLRPGRVANGEQTELQVPVIGRLEAKWVARHEDVEPGHRFRDVQVSGPFARWVHEHRFEDGPDGSTIVTDSIEYALPLGALGRVARRRVEERLARVFAHRHALLAGDVMRHRAWAPPSPWTFAVTGATGFVGSSLVPFLSTGGHCVKRIGRGPRNDVRWDPEKGELDARALEGVDAVIHLAGESVASGRWTKKKKARILESRVKGTRLLVEALGKLAQPPRVLVSASAIGYYGDRKDEVLDETSSRGEGFLAYVCEEWEREALAAEKVGIRVVTPRIGVVLGCSGGALARMLLPFRLGLGGPLGNGKGWMSWIALDDLIGVLAFSAFTEDVRGAVNAVAPNPATSRELARVLGRVLGRPAVLPAPALALRVALGELAPEVLLASARVRPTVLERAGFPFLHPTLEDALRFELGRNGRHVRAASPELVMNR